MEILANLVQKDVVCPFMAEAGYNNLKINICDNHAWKIRKKYPIMFDCCEFGNCIGREKGIRNPMLECDYRDDCSFGQQCQKSSKNCNRAELLKGKRIRNKFIAKITRNLPRISSAQKSREIIEKKLLAANL